MGSIREIADAYSAYIASNLRAAEKAFLEAKLASIPEMARSSPVLRRRAERSPRAGRCSAPRIVSPCDDGDRRKTRAKARRT